MSAGQADYIVVGAGSAGCLLASRLAADADSRVMLLEAGGRDWNPILRLPLLAGLAYYLKSVNWGYQTEPQAGLAQRRIRWPRGRVLGGCSSINGMMAIRGHASDYRDWRALGLPGWDYDDVLPAFRSIEHNLAHPDHPHYHGADGAFHAERAPGDNPIYGAWLAAAAEAGHPANDDFNGPRQEGLGLYDFNIRRGRRVSAATAYLGGRRANLEIVTRAEVERLSFSGRRCTGVVLRGPDGARSLTAAREVILCAGAVNSPVLLQRSGIGPAALLAGLGIPLIHHSPGVGANLQDHLGIYLQYRCTQPVTLYGLMRPDRALLAGLRALLLGDGPAASVPLQAGGFLRSLPDLDRPDVHITVVPGLSLEAHQSGQREHGFLTNIYQLRPESRGEVRITSADSGLAPLILPNYLSAEADRRCLRRSVALVRHLMAQPALDAFRGAEIAPGADVSDDAGIDDWISRSANTIFHPVGTCRMGSDPEAVLDARLRVRGLEGLRVADASAMPTLIGGNTALPTMMIAARAADFIQGRD